GEEEFREDLLTESSERKLLIQYTQLAPEIEHEAKRESFTGMLDQLALLIPPSEAFLTTPLIGPETPEHHQSRLALCHRLQQLFRLLGDLTALEL
ncbi:MAG TPA: DALR anticodon-binding domain-containing protein, partial [Armatimonadota bacterium]|nr:DALR anticodon-binding domain-containing protein [Armatimonadota bacterium]